MAIFGAAWMYPMTNGLLIRVGRAALALLACLWLLPPAASCQDSGEQGTNMRGSRAEIAVTVRDKSGRQVITAPTVIKLYKNGALEDQRSTSQGRAFFIARGLGEFTVAVEAAATRQRKRKSRLRLRFSTRRTCISNGTRPRGPKRGLPAGPCLLRRRKRHWTRDRRL